MNETVNEIPRMILQVIRTSQRSPRLFYWGLILRIFARASEAAPFVLLYLWFSDRQTGGGATESGWLVIAIAGTLLFQWLLSYFGQLASFLGSYRLMAGYRGHVLRHLGRIPIGDLRRERIGQTTEVITEDVKRVETIFTHLVAELIACVTVPVVLVVGLLWVDWRIGIGFVVVMLVAPLALHATKSIFVARGRHKQALFQDAAGLVVEFVTGLITLRSFRRTDAWVARLEHAFTEIRKASMGAEAWGAGPVQLYRLVIELGWVAILVSGAILAAGHDGLPFHWLLFVLLGYRIMDPLHEAASLLTELRFAVQSEDRVRAMLTKPTLSEPALPQAPQDASVELDAVRFSYGGDGWTLDRVGFHVPAGTVTAVVGSSGAGKSTILHLLARFADPQEGRIQIGGIDVRSLGSEVLYQHISIVFQDVQLFDGSVFENVRIARADASDAEVIEACRAAYADHFVEKLPEGYHTKLGENGMRLSGGERQRLSIARALLKDAPILLLDEVTASVDLDAQYEIQRALSRLVAGRTVIVVAHRLHTIRDADQIVVLEHGTVAERGTHEQLLAREGTYAELWRAERGETGSNHEWI